MDLFYAWKGRKSVWDVYNVSRNALTMSMNSFTRFSSTAFSKIPSILKVVAQTAPSAADNCLVMLSLLQPVLQRIGVCLTAFLTWVRTCVSVSLPAVNPETHNASGRLLNSVDFAISAIFRSARYLAAYGTILNNIFKFYSPISIL